MCLSGGFAPLVCQILPFIIPFIRKNIPIVRNRSIRGVTLIELLITLVVGTILLTIAVPTMTNLVHSNRITSATNDFIGALGKVRDEALKGQAAICKSGGGTTCVTTGGWESGWIVFADVDANAHLNNTMTASDIVLQTYESLPTGVNVTTTSNIIVFDRQGSRGAATIAFCNSRAKQRNTIGLTNSTGRHTLTHVLTDGTCP